MPQFWPVALNASGGAPTETSRRNWSCRAQTSALSPSTMNGRSPSSATPCAVRAGLLPLIVRQPLQVLMEEHLARELAARIRKRAGVAAAKRLGPFGPGAAVLLDRAWL